MFIAKTDDILEKYTNTYHIPIKIKLLIVKSSIYIDFCKENNYKYPKFEINYHVRILKYKKIFAKGSTFI